MAKPNQEQVRQLGDFLQSIRWDIVFPNGVPGTPNSEGLNLRMESSTVPTLSGEGLEANIRGLKSRQPGAYTYSKEIELELFETTDMFCHGAVKAWRDLCWDPVTGMQQPVANTTCDIQMMRLDGGNNPIWQYYVRGAFQEKYKPGEMNSENKIVKMGMTLSYTYFVDGPI